MNKDFHSVYVDAFAESRESLPGRGVGWLDGLRARAIERFADAGFPTPKDEVWKFTNLRPLTRQAFSLAPRGINSLSLEDLSPHLPEGLACHRMVFVDGHFRADLSDIGDLPDGASLASLAETLNHDPAALEAYCTDQGDSPAALNTAFMADGAVLMIDQGVALEKPVHLLYLATAQDGARVNHPRNLIVAGVGARATVIESYAGAPDGVYWTNVVTDVIVERDAVLKHVKFQNEGGGGFHLAATRTRIAAGATYDNFTAQMGARLARNEIVARFDGEGATCRLKGLFLGRGRQHLDITTLVDHAEPGCFSDEYYKGVLDGNAHGVFQGKIIVRPDAQKTDAHQLSKNLLLSDSAQVDTKPELEIYADDVKCSHGAATGELDEDALFYMRSRGIEASEAERMLVEGFVGEIVETIDVPELTAHMRRAVAAWLAPRATSGK